MIAAVMRDKYCDPDSWKRCTLRHNIELGKGLWLLCGPCQKSRDYDIADWAMKHGVDLDTPLKTLGRGIRCQRCGTLGILVYAHPYDNLPPRPSPQHDEGDPVCPACDQTMCINGLSGSLITRPVSSADSCAIG